MIVCRCFFLRILASSASSSWDPVGYGGESCLPIFGVFRRGILRQSLSSRSRSNEKQAVEAMGYRTLPSLQASWPSSGLSVNAGDHQLIYRPKKDIRPPRIFPGLAAVREVAHVDQEARTENFQQDGYLESGSCVRTHIGGFGCRMNKVREDLRRYPSVGRGWMMTITTRGENSPRQSVKRCVPLCLPPSLLSLSIGW